MEVKSFIKKYIAIFVIAIIAITIISIIIKYQVEGESNIPFEISKIMVISTAGGNNKENSQNKWDLEIIQNNDIYIDIIRNKNYGQGEIIDKVIINNFSIQNNPIKGNIKLYRANNENGIFNNTDEYKIENEVVFNGGEISSLEDLQIANQGGLILIRCVNEQLGDYTSNEDEQIRHDGTLLEKIGITNEEIKFSISFDIAIELKSEKKFKTRVTLDMPIGNLIQEGTTNYQLEKDKIIFKRY